MQLVLNRPTTLPTTLPAPSPVPTPVPTPVPAPARSAPARTDEPEDTLLAAARLGDERAWRHLHFRYNRLVLATAGRYGLDHERCADVAQVTWLRLLENVDRIRDDRAVPAWLVTTASREALSVLRRVRRETPYAEQPETPLPEGRDDVADLVHRLTVEDVAARLREAVAVLPVREQRLMLAMLRPEAPSYSEMSRELGMPVGSIGPVRARAFRRLRGLLSDEADVVTAG